MRHLTCRITLLAFISLVLVCVGINSVVGSTENGSNPKPNGAAVDEDVIALFPGGPPQRGSLPASATGDCILSSLQYSYNYSVPGEGLCDLIDRSFWVEMGADQNLKLYIRFGERVRVEGDRILADYASQSASRHEVLSILASSSPSLRAGTYFIAVSNCGSDPASYQILASEPLLDFGYPVILGAKVVGERLLVYGAFPGGDGKLFVNDKKQKQVVRDDQQGCLLIGNKSGKKIAPGETVILRARFPFNPSTPEFEFTRPPE